MKAPKSLEEPCRLQRVALGGVLPVHTHHETLTVRGKPFIPRQMGSQTTSMLPECNHEMGMRLELTLLKCRKVGKKEGGRWLVNPKLNISKPLVP